MSDRPDLETLDEPGRAAWLRRDAERISGALPPLLVEADRLVMSLLPGVHGRKRSGPGETFWQYRPAHPGDSLSQIDWRRSGRSDKLFVREMEWEAAQSVMIWCDRSLSMAFKSERSPRTKGARAELLTLALAVLLARGDERFGLLGTEAEIPTTGEAQLFRMGAILARAPDGRSFGAAPEILRPRIGRAVYFSDFLGPEEEVLAPIRQAAKRGIAGVLVQILDPVEEDYPFGGRTKFVSLGQDIDYETDEAHALRSEYLGRLARRRDALAAAARGWRLIRHRTDESPRRALLALHTALGGS